MGCKWAGYVGNGARPKRSKTKRWNNWGELAVLVAVSRQDDLASLAAFQ